MHHIMAAFGSLCLKHGCLTLDLDLQLLQHGANVHYVTNLPEASTALHEAVQRSHDGMVELLLRYGANAFLENGRGTA